MSTFHDALYAQVPLSRETVFARILPVLGMHGIRFLNSVRGLRWDAASNEFTPDTDQELDDLHNLQQAYLETAKWQCVCVDLRFGDAAIEWYVFSGKSPAETGNSVFFSFPQSIYKAAKADEVLAAKWLGFLAQVGKALGGAAMICGIEVLMIPAHEEQLMARFKHFLEAAEAGSYVIHTVLAHDLKFTGPLEEKRRAMKIASEPIEGAYQLWTQLAYDRDVLVQAMAEPNKS